MSRITVDTETYAAILVKTIDFYLQKGYSILDANRLAQASMDDCFEPLFEIVTKKQIAEDEAGI